MARSRLDQARARLEWLDIQIEFTRIRSPFAGTLVEQFQYPGDMAKPDAPIFTIIDFSKAVARAQVPQAEAAAVRVGQEGRFVPAGAMSPTYSGRVSVVSRAVDPSRQTVEVWCEIPRPDPSLRAGMYGSLTLFTGEAPGSLLVPLSAVQFKEGTRTGFVMVVDKKGQARQREVEAGETFGRKVRILRGLAPGERVIVEGAYGLPEGTKVKLQEGKGS